MSILRTELEKRFSEVFPGYDHATCIGYGGQGEVFRAVGPRGICAIKVFGLDDRHQIPVVHDRIRREISMAQRITAIIDGLSIAGQDRLVGIWKVLGQHEIVEFHGHRLFGMVMRYFQEGTLEHWRRERQQLDLWMLHALVDDLVSGLGCLHALNLVHHDLKPSNIFIASETMAGVSRPRAFIGDFGCTRHQHEHTRMLDKRYAPPDHDEMSGESWDMYSLAMVLLFLIRGDLADEAWQVSPFNNCHLTIAHRALATARTRQHVSGTSMDWYDGMLRLIKQASAFQWQLRPSLTDFSVAVHRLAVHAADAGSHRESLWRNVAGALRRIAGLNLPAKPESSYSAPLPIQTQDPNEHPKSM